ncbi:MULTISPECIES: serine/threonine-protein kinase [Sorangium]|uniref:Serine/threonine-protein kinase n=1 Tax=Sorangium atrum TaxID=2995308 RepID=A0ABT5C8W4_9BACT|nr:serine/threonine-protein kinase [Sorangium aterium]MDC0682184.1 serine/threonine-protein kinase [Sorangium aterium]
MNPLVGEIIDGKYRIVRLLGQGGMGAVFEGENVRIRRRVAIKLLHANISSQAESVARFEREAQAAARIGSDHICEVLDLGVLPDGTRYMVMEYLEGETLGAKIERMGRLGPEITVPIMVQVLEALGAAHAAGIIHRDLKPDNIFVIPSKAGLSNFVKVLDFGVSKFSQLAGSEMSMTRTGAVVGTPYYMSPEQARGSSPVDQRTDIYAMGVLLFQATTGQVPFDAATFNELLFKIVLEPAPLPQQLVPDLDAEFSGIIQKAMAREPGGRFQSCAEFKNTLLAWAAARPSLALLTTGRTSFPRLSLPSQPDTTTPPPTRTEPPWGGQHGAAVPGMGQTPQLTANSWGASSGVTGRSTRPASRMPLLAAIAGAASLFGAGVAVWLAFGHSGTTGAASAGPSAVGATAIPAPSPPPPAPPTAPPTEPIVTASATVAEPAPSVTAEPVAAPTASSAQVKPLPPRPQPPQTKPLPVTRPPHTAPSTKPSTSPQKPQKPGVPGDFGY